jgi:hypothetical protein
VSSASLEPEAGTRRAYLEKFEIGANLEVSRVGVGKRSGGRWAKFINPIRRNRSLGDLTELLIRRGVWRTKGQLVGSDGGPIGPNVF